MLKNQEEVGEESSITLFENKGLQNPRGNTLKLSYTISSIVHNEVLIRLYSLALQRSHQSVYTPD